MISVRNIRNQEETALPATQTVVLRDSPLVLSAPHGGSYVLERYADNFTFGKGIYVDNDMYTAEVYPLDLGSSIAAHLCPHQVNINRVWDPMEPGHDPIRMNSYIADDPIYTQESTNEERVDLGRCWKSYHTELARLMHRMRDTYGYALLIDCHSLNSRALLNTPDAGSSDRADFVIGTLEDSSADPRILDIFHEALEKEATPRGLRVVRNDPYKGGLITQTWAQPQNGIHAIQLELKKKLYMFEGIDEGEGHAFEKRESFEDIQVVLRNAYTATRDGVHQLLSA